MKSLRARAIVEHVRRQRLGRAAAEAARVRHLYRWVLSLGVLLSAGLALADDEETALNLTTHWVVVRTANATATLTFAADTAHVTAKGEVIATKKGAHQGSAEETITFAGNLDATSLKRCSTGWCVRLSKPADTCPTLGLQLSKESSAHVIGSDLHLILTEPDDCCATCVTSQELVLSLAEWEFRSVTTSEPTKICDCEVALVKYHIPMLLIREGF